MLGKFGQHPVKGGKVGCESNRPRRVANETEHCDHAIQNAKLYALSRTPRRFADPTRRPPI